MQPDVPSSDHTLPDHTLPDHTLPVHALTHSDGGTPADHQTPLTHFEPVDPDHPTFVGF
jgi:hypothetical protein